MKKKDIIPNYFPEKPWACKCGCGANNINSKLVEMLNLTRHKCKIPFIINSAVRCSKYNLEVGGERYSAHTLGCAVDIYAGNSLAKFLIIKNALEVGFNRIGVGRTFIHLDIDATKVQNVIWSY